MNPDPALKLCQKLPYEEFTVVNKTKKIAKKVKTKELVQINLLYEFNKITSTVL